MVQSPGLLGSRSLSRPMATQAGPDPLWHPLRSAALCIHPMGWATRNSQRLRSVWPSAPQANPKTGQTSGC